MRLLFLIILLLLPLRVLSKELSVFSAAGVMDFMKEAGREYEKTSGSEVIFNFSSSGKLAKQIELGAPADCYASASKFWVDYLKRKKLLKEGTIKPFATTELVVVAPKESKIKNITQAQTIAVGNRFAPVGIYAVESLKNLGLYDKLKNRLIYGPTVRTLTIWVITGNASAAIIYYSDYLKFKNRLKLVEVLPKKSHRPIEFYLGCTGRKLKECKAFEDFLFKLPEKTYEKFGLEKEQ
ncbi:molybdate ABC transporter substrate-binding protein [Thermovibrio sp.]